MGHSPARIPGGKGCECCVGALAAHGRRRSLQQSVTRAPVQFVFPSRQRPATPVGAGRQTVTSHHCGPCGAPVTMSSLRLALTASLLLTLGWLAGSATEAASSRQYQLDLSDQVYPDAPRLRTSVTVSRLICALLCLHESTCGGFERHSSSGECSLLGGVPPGSPTADASGISTYRSPCPPGWFQAPGACFLYVSTERAAFADIPARCAALWPGADVASLRTEEQLAVIREQLTGLKTYVAIGTRRGEGNTWLLPDGSQATVLPWARGQPGSSEQCTCFVTDLTLHDYGCNPIEYLCGLEI